MTPYDPDGHWNMTPTTYKPTLMINTDHECDDDQCEECRAAPGAAHSPDCPGCVIAPYIPLWKQAGRYAKDVDAVLDELHALLAPGTDFRERIIALGFDRLIAGFADYGSEMFAYSPDRRRYELECEVADYLVYGTSGPHQ